MTIFIYTLEFCHLEAREHFNKFILQDLEVKLVKIHYLWQLSNQAYVYRVNEFINQSPWVFLGKNTNYVPTVLYIKP